MTEFDLEPPAPEPTNIEILESWGIKPTWDKENRLWHLPGLGYLHEIIEMDEEDTLILTSRDRHAVEKALEDYGEYLMGHYLDQDIWEPVLGWYARHMDRTKGPAINVRLYDTYEAWRLLEKVFDVDLEEHDVDPEYVAYQDTVDHEMDWFRSEYIDGQFAEIYHLDSKKFQLAGRSGGWLVYDIHSGNYDSGALTLGEATELRDKVWPDVPGMVRNVAHDIVVKQWSWAFEDMWTDAVDDWRDREQQAVLDAVERGDLKAAQWHRSNVAETIDMPDMFDFVWLKFYEALPEPE